jgi:hypothetical protein
MLIRLWSSAWIKEVKTDHQNFLVGEGDNYKRAKVSLARLGSE